MNRALGLLLLCLTTVPTMAALSPALKEWGAGPAQWLMTPDEQRAWRKVATDADAVNFIDLFWARRDPSPGTAVNEYRQEFDFRVKYSDETYSEKRKRGAMTDRGRVYIVLGAGTTMTGMLGQAGTTADSSEASGARQTSTRHIWLWEKEDARKFNMGKIEVVFVEDPITHRVQRDPTRADFGRAGPTAIRQAIVNPDLTAVPAWAATGGLEPVAPFVPEPPAAAAPAASTEIAPVVPAVSATTPGASRLTLLPAKAGRDVPWSMQFCSPKAEMPKLKFMLLIAGPLDGKSAEQRTREKDAKLERTTQPGCYILQGMVPASKLATGRYKVTVMLDDAVTGDAYTVKQEFRVE